MEGVLSDKICIERAVFDSATSGVVSLAKDWTEDKSPQLCLSSSPDDALNTKPLLPESFALESGYYLDDAHHMIFACPLDQYPNTGEKKAKLYLAGSFNGWGEAIGDAKWRMKKGKLAGRAVYMLKVDAHVVWHEGAAFKFVTGGGHWLPVSERALNAVNDGWNSRNYALRLDQTGRHRFGFSLDAPLDFSQSYRIKGADADEWTYLHLGDFFYRLGSGKQLGAIVDEDRTTFRLFAPRAKWVKLGYFPRLDDADSIEWISMQRDADGVWELSEPRNLANWLYWFRLDGPDDAFGFFDPEQKILDPYAKATVSREGPGIIVEALDSPTDSFKTPAIEDLVVVEAHVRDLTARTEHAGSKPLGFKQLEAYSRSDRFYPSQLGVNAIELQPIQENDSEQPGDYHWGYMTANYFSPASSYADDAASASQVEEFRSLVRSLHERGLAVILDVVYNHVGEPAHLMRIDKQYYFHVSEEGELSNWSGCGNDLRCEARMSERLIIDSLKHLVRCYGVDGFRFDLADLVGKPTLLRIEKELRAIKPDVLLIAEPWSFRGHIGQELMDTSYASWNDSYRNFLRDYVRGEGNREGIAYFLKGSPKYYASWPAQTVNYVESHDDRVWIDNITENEGHDGDDPTENDLKRTRLMASLLMMSIGVPMLHAGMDFVQSKQGVTNTYLRGEINALDYERAERYSEMADYFRAWVAFRRSGLGKLLRHRKRAKDSFFHFIWPEHGNGFACVYNASNRLGPKLLFAANPHFEEMRVPLGKWSKRSWRQLADGKSFGGEADVSPAPFGGDLLISPLSSGLWVAKG